MGTQNLINVMRLPYAAQSIKVGGFMSELSTLVNGRLEHAEPEDKWRWTQAVRTLEAFENRNNIISYAKLKLHEGIERSELQEKIIAEYLLPSETELSDVQKFDPVPTLFRSIPRQLSNLELKKMAAGHPGFSVNDVAFDQKMRADEVEQQLRAFVDRKGVERADEVASGEVRKLRFEASIEKLPETFFDLSTYQKRLTGVGDCASIALAICEKESYQVSAAALSDIEQEGGGVRTIDFQSYLFGNGYVSEPVDDGITLEALWNSDLISVTDAGVLVLATGGDRVGNHSIGFRDAKMYVSDPILVSQLFASSEVIGVYLRKSNDATAIARAIKRQASQTPVSIREDTPMTHEDLENLKARLVNEIISNIASQLGVQQVLG